MFDFILNYLKSENFKEILKEDIVPGICELVILLSIATINMYLLYR